MILVLVEVETIRKGDLADVMVLADLGDVCVRGVCFINCPPLIFKNYNEGGPHGHHSVIQTFLPGSPLSIENWWW